jgi:hypothetical protein
MKPSARCCYFFWTSSIHILPFHIDFTTSHLHKKKRERERVGSIIVQIYDCKLFYLGRNIWNSKLVVSDIFGI